ncbi:MAG: phage holin family protein [Prevotella sp.]|nr:phage holin family protein [Prevotella sp.]
MDILFDGTSTMLQVSVLVMILVLLAMTIDLGAGLYKAKLRGELHTSTALRRSLTKFISYEGGLMIATMADIIVHFSKFYSLIHLDILVGVPLFALVVGLFLLVVEFMSVREKADEKTKKQQLEAVEILSKVLNKDDLKDILEKIIERNQVNTEDNG